MIRRLLAWLGSGGETYHECQRCGASVDQADAPCPECGSTDVSSFDLGGGA